MDEDAQVLDPIDRCEEALNQPDGDVPIQGEGLKHWEESQRGLISMLILL